jgi:hypothetical protein
MHAEGWGAYLGEDSRRRTTGRTAAGSGRGRGADPGVAEQSRGGRPRAKRGLTGRRDTRDDGYPGVGEDQTGRGSRTTVTQE